MKRSEIIKNTYTYNKYALIFFNNLSLKNKNTLRKYSKQIEYKK